MRLTLAMLIALGLFTVTAFGQTVEPVKPFNLSAVNTEKDEDEPHSTVIGSANSGNLFYTSGGELFACPRTAKGWGVGKKYTDLNQSGDVRGVFVLFAKPGVSYPQTIFYATNSDVDQKSGRGNNFDMYMLTRQAAGGADFNVPVPINTVCTPADELHPWATSDGKLYFSRKTKDGWRVFVASRPKADRQFEKPVVLDLPAGFHHSTLTPDGKTMYLQGPLEKDRWGLFRSTFTDGKWSEPEELKELNHPDGRTGDRSPNLSRNGAYLFFASDRPGGKGGLDIWWIATDQLKKK
jgi:WD40-like Beta Propeller Repeat